MDQILFATIYDKNIVKKSYPGRKGDKRGFKGAKMQKEKPPPFDQK
ncbi:MAG: hypothetical protein Devi2KO_40630 [Devosia indica]